MVMRPEPWCARRAAVRRPWNADRAVPAGDAVHPGDARELAARTAPDLRLRPVRGHRPAGGRRRGARGCRCRRSRSATTCCSAVRSRCWSILEAVTRLLPGVLGNAESLAEESHAAGLLEAPVYTKPATWRGHDVPEVLRSGDHGRIARWRRDQALLRTAARRPDLLTAYPPACWTTGTGKRSPRADFRSRSGCGRVVRLPFAAVRGRLSGRDRSPIARIDIRCALSSTRMQR